MKAVKEKIKRLKNLCRQGDHQASLDLLRFAIRREDETLLRFSFAGFLLEGGDEKHIQILSKALDAKYTTMDGIWPYLEDLEIGPSVVSSRGAEGVTYWDFIRG